jgi:hypothetical protein
MFPKYDKVWKRSAGALIAAAIAISFSACTQQSSTPAGTSSSASSSDLPEVVVTASREHPDATS